MFLPFYVIQDLLAFKRNLDQFGVGIGPRELRSKAIHPMKCNHTPKILEFDLSITNHSNAAHNNWHLWRPNLAGICNYEGFINES